MANDDVEVVVVGGGAAGIAAAQRLCRASIRALVVEARGRLGGRAWTVTAESGFALDLGCGWLHSADRNPWRRVAEEQGAAIDKTPPPWMRPSLEIGFSRSQQSDFYQALTAFYARLDHAAADEHDAAAASRLDPNCPWNGLINAVSTYVSGVELDRLSVQDFHRYADSGVNWRVVAGYGAIISTYAANLQTVLDCPVSRIDHGAKRIRVETKKGVIAADHAIVTLPSSILAAERVSFTPLLPEKTRAAHGLPLGLADKLFIALKDAEGFDKDSRLFGRTDRAGTGGYHFRPFGRPMIEAYFGGRLAADLEASGEQAFFDFASSELVGLLGSDFGRRLRPIRVHRWGRDPFALGSYSFALPGSADCRAALAQPVDGRLFFAGEACSRHDFSTAHGGWHTGVAAAEQVIAARRRATSTRRNTAR